MVGETFVGPITFYRRLAGQKILEKNNNYGRITIIEDFENVIFVAQETMCHIRYINKTRATMGDGENIVLDSNRFLSAPDYFSMNYGCTHPESYSRNENACLQASDARTC